MRMTNAVTHTHSFAKQSIQPDFRLMRVKLYCSAKKVELYDETIS